MGENTENELSLSRHDDSDSSQISDSIEGDKVSMYDVGCNHDHNVDEDVH